MNFFFFIKNKDIVSNLKIPIFNNDGEISDNLNLFNARISNKKWVIKKTIEKKKNNFFTINSDNYEEDDIFFLAEEYEILNNDFSEKLLNVNNFTDTYPAYRANLKINYKNLGFSSYQSEYPFEMTNKKSSTFSPLKTLLFRNAEKNLLILRNIFHEPIQEKFKTYIIDILSFKVIDILYCTTNSTNYFEINENLIKENFYLFSENYLVLPLFISINKFHVSFEHTQPPQLIMFKESQIFVKKIKEKIQNEIIKK